MNEPTGEYVPPAYSLHTLISDQASAAQVNALVVQVNTLETQVQGLTTLANEQDEMINKLRSRGMAVYFWVLLLVLSSGMLWGTVWSR